MTLVCFVLTAVSCLFAQSENLDLSAYHRVLKNQVDENGQVDYPSLKADPQNLTAFLNSVSVLPPAAYEAWPNPEKIAF